MSSYSPAWPHSEIKQIFPNIFFVMGTNITHYNGVDLQHSRNMVIVRHNDELSLINTVRLNDSGLAALDALGKVKNLIKIGSFHGRDDAFYLDRYPPAKLWAVKGMNHENHRTADRELISNSDLPFPRSSFFLFETSKFPEGVIHIDQEGGIIITCDSVKNWIAPDEYFSEETAELYQQQGAFGSANISSIWKQATNVHASDFEKLMSFSFQHLISAHGEPLLNNAHKQLANSVKESFSSQSS
jgi:hypothetical protein